MIKILRYFATFYGDLTNVREDVSSLSETDPRCIHTGNILMISFTSVLTLSEVNEYLKVKSRLFILQHIDDNLVVNMGTKDGDELGDHLLHYDTPSTEEHEPIKTLQIYEMDKDSKMKLINDLLENYNKLSDQDKIMLEKLSKEENE